MQLDVRRVGELRSEALVEARGVEVRHVAGHDERRERDHLALHGARRPIGADHDDFNVELVGEDLAAGGPIRKGRERRR